jgi:hypothetical protein
MMPGTTWFCRGLMALLGGVSLGLYAAVLGLSFDFAPDASAPPGFAAVAVLGAAYGCYVVALALVLRRRGPETDGWLLWLVVSFSVAYRLVLLPSQPILEKDYYRYLWDGRVLRSGHNPYRYSPTQIDDVAVDDPGIAELRQLHELSLASPALQEIFQRVHYRAVPTVYPPLAQVVFAGAALLTPAGAPVWQHVLVLKAVLVGFDLAALGTLIALLRWLALPRTWSLAYGWCPLVMKEFANSAHLDAMAVFFTVAALYWLVRAVQPRQADTERSGLVSAVTGLALLGLAVLAKSYPVVLLPVIGAVLLARFRQRALVPLAVFAVVVVAGYLPFVDRGERAAEPASQTSHPGTGLKTFLSEWETNDFLFMLVYENLHQSAERAERWFVVVPGAWRGAWHEEASALVDKLGLSFRVNPMFVVAQGIMGLVLLGLCLWWAWNAYHRPGPLELLQASFLTLAWGWLLSSAQNPWYIIWALPFMVFARCRSWFVLPGLVLLYYTSSWVEEASLVWLEYVPFFVALAVETFWRAGSVGKRPELTTGVESNHARQNALASE